jgi:hypothetical protein
MMFIPDRSIEPISGAATHFFSWQTFQQRGLIQLLVFQSTQMFRSSATPKWVINMAGLSATPNH